MDQKQPDIIPWALIGAALNQEATPAQLSQLLAWRQAQPDHEARYQEAVRVWQASGELGPATSFDSQADWPLVWAQLTKPTAKVRTFTPARFMQWAAVILLLIGLMAGIWSVLRPNDPKMLVQLATTNPQTIYLEDSSVVVLRPGSKLTYPETFAETQRQVELEGEAWFEVQSQPKRPFQIQSSHMQVTVLGTAFAVRDGLSDSVAMVDVGEGKVRVTARDSVVLVAGQSARWSDDSLQLVAQNPYFLAWKDGELRFENATVGEVLAGLSRYYQRSFQLVGKPPTGRLTATFQQETLEEVQEILRVVLRLEVLIE